MKTAGIRGCVCVFFYFVGGQREMNRMLGIDVLMKDRRVDSRVDYMLDYEREVSEDFLSWLRDVY